MSDGQGAGLLRSDADGSPLMKRSAHAKEGMKKMRKTATLKRISVAMLGALLVAAPVGYANAHSAGSEAQPGMMQGGQGDMMQGGQGPMMQGGQGGMGMMNMMKMMGQMNQMMASCNEMMKTMSKHLEKEAAPGGGATD